jgi:hypothetical protein
MKNKGLSILLQGVVLVSGIIFTMCLMAFTSTFSGLLCATFIGSTITCLVSEHIAQLNK